MSSNSTFTALGRDQRIISLLLFQIILTLVVGVAIINAMMTITTIAKTLDAKAANAASCIVALL